jgi:hypothetical protein
MARGRQQSNGGLGIIVVVDAIAFMLGKCSDEPSVEPDPHPIADSAALDVEMPADQMQPLYQAAPEPVYEPSPQRVEAPTYFANCSEARAAGAAPVYAGDPGYAAHLDRDDDGVGCE